MTTLWAPFPSIAAPAAPQIVSGAGGAVRARDYQHEAQDAAWRALFDEGDRGTMIHLATGLGKTVIAAMMCRRVLDEMGKRFLCVVHRDELAQQAVEKFAKITGRPIAVEMAQEMSPETPGHRRPIVVASVQTLAANYAAGGVRRKRISRFDWSEFGMAWLDEAHHYVSRSYLAMARYLLAANPDLRLLLTTATPERMDGVSLRAVTDDPTNTDANPLSIAYQKDLPAGIRGGWLVEPRPRTVRVSGLDYGQVGKRGGDLVASQLGELMRAEEPQQQIISATLELIYGLPKQTLGGLIHLPTNERWDRFSSIVAGRRPRRTVLFAPDVLTAARMAEIVNRWMPGLATYVCGARDSKADTQRLGMTKDERRRRLRDFSAGRVALMANCMVLTEGYDEPGIECGVLARATQSKGLFTQMIGRTTRPLDEIAGALGDAPDAEARRAMIAASDKPHVELLDFAGECGRHKLVHVGDVLRGEVPQDLLDEAQAIAERADRAVSIDDVLADLEARRQRKQELEEQEERAEAAYAERVAEEAARLQKRMGLVAAADYDVREGDLFSLDKASTGAAKRSSLTPDPREMLARCKVPDRLIARWTPEERSVYATRLAAREKMGLASYAQRRKLHQWGFTKETTKKMTKADAQAAIGHRMANYRRRPS